MATPHVTGIVAYAMANSTLAQNPALMKDWIRAQGLPRGNGTVLANNGVWSSGDKAMVSPNSIASVTRKARRAVIDTFTRTGNFLSESTMSDPIVDPTDSDPPPPSSRPSSRQPAPSGAHGRHRRGLKSKWRRLMCEVARISAEQWVWGRTGVETARDSK